jgi:hypothetical protein
VHEQVITAEDPGEVSSAEFVAKPVSGECVVADIDR